MEDYFILELNDFYIAFKMCMAGVNLYLLAKIGSGKHFHKDNVAYNFKAILLSILAAAVFAIIAPILTYSWVGIEITEYKSLVIAGIVAFYAGVIKNKDVNWNDI